MWAAAHSAMNWPGCSGPRAKSPSPQSHGATKQNAPTGAKADAVNSAATPCAASRASAARGTRHAPSAASSPHPTSENVAWWLHPIRWACEAAFARARHAPIGIGGAASAAQLGGEARGRTAPLPGASKARTFAASAMFDSGSQLSCSAPKSCQRTRNSRERSRPEEPQAWREASSCSTTHHERPC